MSAISQCCATGSLHTGTPTGTVTKVHGLDCYVAEPSSGSPSGIVVILPDAFGWDLPNNRILADEYAKAGFKVYLPEFMDGASLSPSLFLSLRVFKSTGWASMLQKAQHLLYVLYHGIPFMISCREGICGPRVYGFLKAVRENEGKNLPIGVAGFCWGGYYVTKLCADTERTTSGRRLIDCGFTAHPSNLKYPDDIEKVYLPYSVAAPEYDIMMTPALAKQTREILEAKTEKDRVKGIEHEFVLYDKSYHGFAVRNDEDEVFEASQGKKAEKQAVDWFKKWFANPLPDEA